MEEELEHAMAMGHASAPPADNSQSHIPGQSRLHFPNHFPQRAQRMQGMPCGDPDLRPWSAAKASVSLQHKWAGPPPATPSPARGAGCSDLQTCIPGPHAGTMITPLGSPQSWKALSVALVQGMNLGTMCSS